MRNRKLTVLFVIASVLSLANAACSNPRTLEVPVADSITVIRVSVGYTNASEHEIRDRSVIEKVLALVAANNRGWSIPFGTFPTPKASAVFLDKDGAPLLVVWFGPGWVGARYIENLVWDLSPDKQEELRSELGIGA